ncbi:ASC domain containing protein [Asbolus verrucosus]|uniref:ASC domain containing protein n=1 Tax=Asbolus verrucosus TaxID=1661398 RepID=A0A482VYQ3_ASBVE|nr:ASC domain containing protein [Asbolus verrucosus]
MSHSQDEEKRNDQTDACVNIPYMDSNIWGKSAQFSRGNTKRVVVCESHENCCRIWWITVFIIVLSGCSFMIYKIYEKYETSPVIVSFATKDTPIYKIPFPSITICPETKSVKEKFDYEKVTQKKTNGEVLTPKEEKYLQIMSLLCDDYDFETEAGNNSFINDYFDVLDEIKPDFLGNAINCKLMGDDYDCKDLFVPIMTDEGVCYSFNILDRGQIFNDLVSYSQQNCQLECITNVTLHECECVDIFMPRDNRTAVCGTGSFECVRDIRGWFQYLELAMKFPSDRENFKDFIEDDEGLLDCDCKPLCTDLSYHGETSQTEWKWEEKFRLLNETKYDKNLTHMSRLTVYFKVNHFITSERQELYGPIDFVANFGGLLGLFTGFSILSVMEIIYFLTTSI